MKSELFSVVYTDGDGEDLDLDELNDAICFARENPRTLESIFRATSHLFEIRPQGVLLETRKICYKPACTCARREFISTKKSAPAYMYEPLRDKLR